MSFLRRFVFLTEVFFCSFGLGWFCLGGFGSVLGGLGVWWSLGGGGFASWCFSWDGFGQLLCFL